jgi:hypothetical protein
LFGSKGDLVKVGAPPVEFSEGAEIDTGTVVGELHADGPKSVVDLPIGDHGPAALAPRLDHLHPYNARAPPFDPLEDGDGVLRRRALTAGAAELMG